MIVLYSDNARELELKASEQELYELSKALEEGGAVIKCETEGVAISPYSKLLSRILVDLAPEQDVEIHEPHDESLRITGGQPKFSTFAKVVNMFAKEWAAGGHLHVDYYDNHPYLSPDSVPLVMTHL